MEWLKYVAPILAGVGAMIPLVIKLVECVQKLVKEKKWYDLMKAMMGFMENAELKLQNGEDKKEYVMAMTKITADAVDYDMDEKIFGDMVDAICDLSKALNGKKADGGK